LVLGLGRSFAQLEQKPAEEYIANMEKGGRVTPEQVAAVIAKLKLKPGDIVADIGSGAGLFTIPMAKAVAPATLYAVDIDQKMLDYVADKAKKAGLTNVVTVLGEYDDPKLPVKTLDVAFFHRVLHMIEHRQTYVNTTATYMKPDGRFVIVDKEPEDSTNWMWLKRSDLNSWMAALSFYPSEHYSVFDDRYFQVYQRPYGNSVLLKKAMPAEAAKDAGKATDADKSKAAKP
jgi:ubiquinone/menaquinone biosynthesis C-methylase UbiE